MNPADGSSRHRFIESLQQNLLSFFESKAIS
jgi:hypothetical protein